ncbi:hypothetical protein E4U13_002110 [Claviceps humidiphila]|uniref:proline--tRNA ligase n=3 Tax=Claviceps TaxID=5110 RepID=A0A9P7Q779_9HYPO|nr:hypothetical protein E4U13_002110 [Claviceps humidiphila]
MSLNRHAVTRLASANVYKLFIKAGSGIGVRARSTLSRIWIPTGGVAASETETGHEKLIRAGFLRQSQSGIFQLLPLGLRVQNKLEALLDKHMASIGASKLSLSTLTSEELWRRSGRFDQISSELFRLADRKQFSMMLSPTHEEEVTSLVASTLKSHKDLPLRLYQTTRKYRDEMRPRHGLLRSREFVMKDLYSFDKTFASAVSTYDEVAKAYRAFFADLKLPILVAEASSGDMGGNHSHEYHLPSSVGEDTVISCDSCDYAANDEVATARSPLNSVVSGQSMQEKDIRIWHGITKDRKGLVKAWYPGKGSAGKTAEFNMHAVKEVIPDLDPSIDDPLKAWADIMSAHAESTSHGGIRIINVVDMRLIDSYSEMMNEDHISPADKGIPVRTISQLPGTTENNAKGLDLLRPMEGDGCPRCETGQLRVQKALELGHTFYLGTRYSEPLALTVALPNSKEPVPVEMGCYGIGVSRIFGTVAEHKADERGLQWPRAIAPFEVVVIPSSGITDATLDFYDKLSCQLATSESCAVDTVLDDRKLTFGWKMQDADMIGYPVVVVLGRAWRDKGICEVQCRSLSLKENIPVGDLATYLSSVFLVPEHHFSKNPTQQPNEPPRVKPTDATTMSTGEPINLDTLEPQQLSQVKQQLDEELEHLTTSYAQLHGAQNKFKECLRCVDSRTKSADDKTASSNSVLVPLTNSLYVKGEISNNETVLVDVGTGFLIEKKLKAARDFYEDKSNGLASNLKELEAIVQRKQANVRAVEEVLRHKIMAAQASQPQEA